MSGPRAFQLGLRRAAVPAMQFRAAGRMVPRRMAQTNHIAPEEGNIILANQRKQRPVSPHLAIYKPQITWYGSSLHRITGLVLSGSLYLFGMAYLAAPALGWHLESQSLIAGFAAWPAAAKLAAKFTYSMPFFYHSLNGLRHLSWDMGYAFKNKTVMRTGWAVVGASVVLSLYYSTVG